LEDVQRFYIRLEDVQRFYIVLRPEGAAKFRLLVVGPKAVAGCRRA
jgi:hypothetical protein